MTERAVNVWGKTYSVEVHQKSQIIWEAVGKYLGESIRGLDSSEGAALRRWSEAAHYTVNLISDGP
ncbi:MAG TPA: hypothetical protein VEH78_05395 [Pseudolabrys sp.]|nr:hypothetical protein [Pseudolabrys sp.]